MTTKRLPIAFVIVVALLVGWIGGESLSQPASAAQAYATQTQIVALQKQISALQVNVRDTNANLKSWSTLLSSELGKLANYSHELAGQIGQNNYDSNSMIAAENAIKCIEQAGARNDPYGYSICGY